MTGNSAHVVDVPFWDYILRFVQFVIAIGLLCLTAYGVAFGAYDSVSLALFAAIWDLAILCYYLISVHALPYIYNWVAVVVVEALTVAFYAATFSSVAALYANKRYRGLLYTNVIISIFSISAFAFLLHVITLGYVAHGVRKHRSKGLPLFSPQTKAAREREATRQQHQPEVTQTTPASAV